MQSALRTRSTLGCRCRLGSGLNSRTLYRSGQCGQHQYTRASALNSQPGELEAEAAETLSAEEDWTVPGGYQDSLSSNTPLGRAVQDACQELDHLVGLERQSMQEAEELLQKLGVKLTVPGGTAVDEDHLQQL